MEKELEPIDINEDDKRMTLELDSLEIKNDKGRFISGEEAKNYLKEQKEKMLKIKDELEIGTQVKLYKSDSIYEITSNNGEMFKYKGTIPNFEKRQILFNQEDIEKIVT